MDQGATETQPGPSRRPAKGTSRNAVRAGAIVALAVAAGIVAWVLIDRSDDEDAAPATTAEAAPTLPTTTTPTPTTPAETVSRPAFRTIPELRAAAAASTRIRAPGARSPQGEDDGPHPNSPRPGSTNNQVYP